MGLLPSPPTLLNTRLEFYKLCSKCESSWHSWFLQKSFSCQHFIVNRWWWAGEKERGKDLMYGHPCSKVPLTIYLRMLLKFTKETTAKHSTSGQKLSWFYVLLNRWPISPDCKVGSGFAGYLRKTRSSFDGWWHKTQHPLLEFFFFFKCLVKGKCQGLF